MLTRNTALLNIEVAMHLEADALIKGDYWDETKGKGCFIGCLAHSSETNRIEEKFGIPSALMKIAESIHESIPVEEGREFFRQFPSAVGRDGKDLTRVSWAWLAETLRELPPQDDAVQRVIDPVIEGMEIMAAGGQWGGASAHAARAARETAYAAYAAAYAAERTRQWKSLIRIIATA